MKKCPNCEGNRIRYIHNFKTNKNVYKCNECGYTTANIDEIVNTKVDIDGDKKLLIQLYRARNNNRK